MDVDGGRNPEVVDAFDDLKEETEHRWRTLMADITWRQPTHSMIWRKRRSIGSEC